MKYLTILDSLKTFLAWLSPFLIGAFLFYVKDPNTFKIHVGKLNALFKAASFQRRAVKNEVEGRIGKVSNLLNEEIGGIQSNDIEVKWLSSVNMNRESFIKENKVVVRLDYTDNNDRNLAVATYFYVKEVVIPIGKKYLSSEYKKAIDLVVTKKMLKKTSPKSVEHFFDEILAPTLNQNDIIRGLVDKLTIVDQYGLLTNIFLYELSALSKMIYPDVSPGEEVLNDIVKLFEFLYWDIALRNPGDINSDMEYKSKYFSLGLIIVGRLETLETQGIRPYLTCTNILLRQGIKNIYICARSSRRKYASMIEEELQNNPHIEIIEKKEYITKTVDDQSYNSILLVIKEKDEKKLVV